jgi:hypothetical protein
MQNVLGKVISRPHLVSIPIAGSIRTRAFASISPDGACLGNGVDFTIDAFVAERVAALVALFPLLAWIKP